MQQYIDKDGDPFEVHVRTTQDQLSTPLEQLVAFTHVAEQHKWDVALDDLHRVADEVTYLPSLDAPEALVLVMTFGSPVETFKRYVEALRERVELRLHGDIDLDSLEGTLQLNPACTMPKPGLAWWRINLDAHMPSLADEVEHRRRLDWLLFYSSKCSDVQSVIRPDLAHASVLAMALMHPRWRAVEGRLNDVRMGGYLWVRDPKRPFNNCAVELHRGSADSSRRRLYGLDLTWWGNSMPSAIPVAEPVRFD